MAKKGPGKEYIDEFIEAQDNQYTQWKYPLSGRPAPMDEARGNAKLYGFLWFGFAGLFLVLALVMAIHSGWGRHADTGFKAATFGLMPGFALLCVLLGYRYLQKHKRRREQAKRMHEERSRKRKRYKIDK